MPLTRKQKKEIVSELKEKFDQNKSVVITDYTGVTAEELRELRRQFYEKNCDYQVVKKTLLKLALEEADIEGLNPEELEGQIGIGISEDEVTAPKLVHKFGQEHNYELIIDGLLNQEKAGKETMEKLAQLPGKQQLQANLVGSLNAPIANLRNTLAGNLNKLTAILKARQEKLA